MLHLVELESAVKYFILGQMTLGSTVLNRQLWLCPYNYYCTDMPKWYKAQAILPTQTENSRTLDLAAFSIKQHIFDWIQMGQDTYMPPSHSKDQGNPRVTVVRGVMILTSCSGFEFHCAMWLRLPRMRPYKPRFRVAAGVARRKTLTAKSHKC
jgi:hypothetical protein